MASPQGRWQKIEAVYHAARDCQPPARDAFLTEVCAGDEALRSDVESLLAQDVSTDGLLDTPLPKLFGSLIAAAEPLRQLANNRFELIRPVGAGSMGVVYEAWDRERELRVALKVLNGFDPDSLYRFKNEFRSLADLIHPNLVALFEFFQEDGTSFFSMEFVEGAGFVEYVRERSGDAGNFDEARLRAALRQFAEALLCLHGAGLLHCDLKPANVKVTPEGRVVVLDFGLAMRRTSSTFEETTPRGIFGTPAYMAPEQAAGETVGAPADFYAAGVMAYEALTGRRPFEGFGPQLIHLKQRSDPPAPASLVMDVPDDLNTLCQGLLRRDPATRMTGAELQAVLARGATDAVTAAAPHPFPAVFVGRRAQRALLSAAFAGVKKGVPGVVFMHGKSGIGKSALAEHFLHSLSSQSSVVLLTGRCYEQESMPFKALDSVVDSLARYLARLPRHEAAAMTPRDAAVLTRIFPVLRRVEAIAAVPSRPGPEPDRHELRNRAFAALRELLARLSDRRRVVLFIDDLQWGDADSASLLRDVLRGPEAPVLLLLGAYRDGYEGRSPFLDALRKEALGDAAQRHDLALGSLDEGESRELAELLLGADSQFGAETIQTIARESEGNPYFIQELTAGNFARGNTLDSVLSDRVAALPEEARMLLEIVAVSGRPVGRKEACLAARFEGQDQKLLAGLRIARLIGGAGNEIECYHDRVRESIITHLDPSTLKMRHFRLAETLEAAGGEAETIAIHLDAAGLSDRASSYYTVAAESAASTLAFKHAASLYKRALDLSPLKGAPRRQLLLRLAEALGNAGRGADAGQAYREAARTSPASEVFELKRREAFWFSVSGRLMEGREALDQMLGSVGLNTPRPALVVWAIAFQQLRIFARGLSFRPRAAETVTQRELDRVDAAWDASRCFGMIDVPPAFYFAMRSLLLALECGEPARIARSLILATSAAAVMPLVNRSASAALQKLFENLVRQGETPYLRGAMHFTEALLGLVDGRWKKSIHHSLEGERVYAAECSGAIWEISTIRVYLAWDLLHHGRYADLRRYTRAFTDDAEERGDLYASASIACCTLPFTELIADRPMEAMRMMDAALARWKPGGYSIQLAFSAWVRGWILLYQGDCAAAWTFLGAEWPKLRRSLYLRMGGTGPWLHFTRAQTALAMSLETAKPARFLRCAQRDARRLEADHAAFSRILARLIRAGLASRQGDTEKSLVLLESAIAGFEEVDMLMLAEFARYRLGQARGDGEGSRMIEQAASAMKLEGVVKPAALADVFVNGFAARSAKAFSQSA